MSMVEQIALTLIKNVGYVTSRALITHFESPAEVYKAGKSQLMEVPGVGAVIAQEILSRRSLKEAEMQLNAIRKHHIKVLYFDDEAYPERLRHCADAPLVLYYKGEADLNRQRMISVVGTRNATAYGKDICRQLASALAPYQVTIVSGMAYGIDIAAHQESLNAGIPTVGVLAHGLDRIYPSAHFGVARKMMENGGLITEFPLFTSPEKENFPKRNRIIAGMSDATIVVEAAVKGGALITADIANSYCRDVYAFPGRTTDRGSAGCNMLIRTNQAGLISDAEDLIYNLGWEPLKSAHIISQRKLPVGLQPDEQKLVSYLSKGPQGIDHIALNMSVPQSQVALTLLNLEMNGVISALPGKRYQLCE